MEIQSVKSTSLDDGRRRSALATDSGCSRIALSAFGRLLGQHGLASTEQKLLLLERRCGSSSSSTLAQKVLQNTLILSAF